MGDHLGKRAMTTPIPYGLVELRRSLKEYRAEVASLCEALAEAKRTNEMYEALVKAVEREVFGDDWGRSRDEIIEGIVALRANQDALTETLRKAQERVAEWLFYRIVIDERRQENASWEHITDFQRKGWLASADKLLDIAALAVPSADTTAECDCDAALKEPHRSGCSAAVDATAEPEMGPGTPDDLCDCGHEKHRHSYLRSNRRWGHYECHASACDCRIFTPKVNHPKTDALLDLQNAAWRASSSTVGKATALEIYRTLIGALGDDYFKYEQVVVRRKEDGLWLHFGDNAAISLDSILKASGPIVARNVRDFCLRLAPASGQD